MVLLLLLAAIVAIGDKMCITSLVHRDVIVVMMSLHVTSSLRHRPASCWEVYVIVQVILTCWVSFNEEEFLPLSL